MKNLYIKYLEIPIVIECESWTVCDQTYDTDQDFL